MKETKVPQTKNDAFAQLDAFLSEKDKSELAKSDPIEFHFSLGMWIRNNWIYEQDEEDVTRMAKAFRTDFIFFDPDGLSGNIKKSLKTVVGKTADFAELAKDCVGCRYARLNIE